jgi:hypothetical protein
MARTLARRLAAAIGVLCATWGCSTADSGDSAIPDTARTGRMAADSPAPERAPLSPADTSRAATTASVSGLGLWSVASLEKRLDLQGMAPRRQAAPIRHPFLSVDGVAYLIGNAELQTFIYDDAAAMERDIARLDTIAVAPRGETVNWPTKATLIRNNNLAAILLGQNALQIERVQRALMAGLPPAP